MLNVLLCFGNQEEGNDGLSLKEAEAVMEVISSMVAKIVNMPFTVQIALCKYDGMVEVLLERWYQKNRSDSFPFVKFMLSTENIYTQETGLDIEVIDETSIPLDVKEAVWKSYIEQWLRYNIETSDIVWRLWDILRDHILVFLPAKIPQETPNVKIRKRKRNEAPSRQWTLPWI